MRWNLTWGLTIAVLAGPGFLMQGRADDQTSPKKTDEKLVSPAETPKNAGRSYWIGLVLEDVHPVVKEQLGLSGGVTVSKVLPGSPAEKAKVKQNDIILSSNKDDVKTPGDMQKAIAACMGGELSLDILRGGSKINIGLTPELSPENLPAAAAGGADDVLKKLKEQMRDALGQLKLEGEGLDIDIDLMGPAIVLQSQAQSDGKMPEDLQIGITKLGNDPARISVKQKDRSWDITEDKIDELPADIRPHVRSMLGGKSISVGEISEEGAKSEFGEKIRQRMEQARQRAESVRESMLKDQKEKLRGVEKAELQRIEAEIKRLQQQMEKLQKGGAGASLRSPSESSLQSPSEKPVAKPGMSMSGGFAEASAETVINNNGVIQRSQTKSSTRGVK